LVVAEAFLHRSSVLALLVGVLPSGASAATLPNGFTETLITAINNPTAMAIAPDGRVFVSEQAGNLRVVKNGVLLSTPFVTIAVNSSGERGLLGVALDPNFASNQFVYVYHTTSTPPIHNHIVRYTANGDVAVIGSEVPLFELDNLGPTNHNGGGLHFGGDGKLYASAGENGNPANAQSLGTVLGKILRLNPDGTIPTDNPFYGTATGNNRAIWALGLRNPFTFDFQPGTGRLFINDVGEGTWEEIDDGLAGANYGWPTIEGPSPAGNVSFTYPLDWYSHTGGAFTGCAIIGAAFYNPTSATFPADYQGKYFFGDYCGGFIRRMTPPVPMATPPATDTDFATGISSLVDLRVASNGDLYYLSQGDGLVRVHYTGPAILTNPVDQTVIEGQTATFSVVASGDAILSYQWQRDGLDVGGATNPSYTTPTTTLADTGATFRCVVTNSVTSVTSASATLTVNVNQAPTANGQSVTTVKDTPKAITLTGSDPEAGALTFTVLTPPGHGVLSGTAPNLTYAPATSYLGADSFTFQVTDPLGAPSAPASVSITVAAGARAGDYYTVTPCRLLDTRQPTGPLAGPALAAVQTRSFTVAGNCGVPVDATAVFLNVTVVAPSAPGNLRIFPTGTSVPSTSALNFVAGQTRANNGVYALGAGGQLDLFLGQASGTADAIVDISGYFVGP
jgi:glucose/arabinose dehydrogenase